MKTELTCCRQSRFSITLALAYYDVPQMVDYKFIPWTQNYAATNIRLSDTV